RAQCAQEGGRGGAGAPAHCGGRGTRPAVGPPGPPPPHLHSPARHSAPPDPKGAYDSRRKPLDLQKLDRVLGEALKVGRLMREPAVLVGTHPDDGQAREATVGSCPEARDRLLLPWVLG